MKQLLYILFLLPCLAQAQSDTTRIPITLRAEHHAYIVGYLGNMGSVDKIRYTNQLALQITDTVNKAKMVTVSVPLSLIKEAYVTLGAQPERFTSTFNDAIKAALMPQVLAYPSLVRDIQAIEGMNAETPKAVIRQGFSFILNIRR